MSEQSCLSGNKCIELFQQLDTLWCKLYFHCFFYTW